MREVQVLEATRTAPNSRGRVRSNPITVERIRVAAYVRVSTDDDDQLGSFESQKLYYVEKIGENPEWVNAGIFADEAITGTKTDKRTGFQEMINRCLNGEIDLILTKSISRFAEIRWIPCSIPECLRIRISVLFLKKKISAPWICRARCF